MILPAGILRWQVEQSRDRLTDLIENVISEKEKVTLRTLEDLDAVKTTLFELGKVHIMLRNR
jgi:hypothetical protein